MSRRTWAARAASGTTHLEWDGTTATAACAWLTQLPVGTCQFAEQPNGTWTEFAPGATAISGVVTYEARLPALNNLRIYVFGVNENGMPTSVAEFYGFESIPFSVDLTALAGHHHALSIHGDYREVRLAQGGVLAEAAQRFHVAIDLTVG